MAGVNILDPCYLSKNCRGPPIGVEGRRAGSMVWLSAYDVQRYKAAKKNLFLAVFLLTLFEYMLKYPHVCQQTNINRRQAIDIAENRTFSYQKIHAKKHRS